MGTNRSQVATQPDHEARRPDLSLVERIELARTLLLEAPRLATREERRARLVTCEALLRYCALELEAILDDPRVCFRGEREIAEASTLSGVTR